MKDFDLQILSQYWIDNDPDNDTDLCSHGVFHLRINSQEILTRADEEWTVSTSTLLLLRTLFQDYNSNSELPLILHCGMVSMISCPISVTWSVKHREKKVFVEEIRKNPTVNTNDAIEFPDASVVLEPRLYALPIVKCAEDVADFFQKGKRRKFSSAYEKNEFGSFWEEFTELKSRARDMVRI